MKITDAPLLKPWNAQKHVTLFKKATLSPVSPYIDRALDHENDKDMFRNLIFCEVYPQLAESQNMEILLHLNPLRTHGVYGPKRYVR